MSLTIIVTSLNRLSFEERRCGGSALSGCRGRSHQGCDQLPPAQSLLLEQVHQRLDLFMHIVLPCDVRQSDAVEPWRHEVLSSARSKERATGPPQTLKRCI